MTLEEIKKKYNGQGQFEKIKRRIRGNRDISLFYEWLADDTPEVVHSMLTQTVDVVPSPRYMNISKNVLDCCQYWKINYFRPQGTSAPLALFYALSVAYIKSIYRQSFATIAKLHNPQRTVRPLRGSLAGTVQPLSFANSLPA